MELLPKGANFIRAKTLWEIGLHIAGNPATPYGGNRDMASWRMIGYPGLPATYHEDIKRYFGKKYDKPPRSIADFS